MYAEGWGFAEYSCFDRHITGHVLDSKTEPVFNYFEVVRSLEQK